MKILVTGASGQLGYDVCKALNAHGIENKGVDLADFDITNRTAAHDYIVGYVPDAVIHCSAWTAVDKAEDEPERCRMVNVEGTRNIALACKEIGAKLLYISSDYIFSGEKEGFYKPDDPAAPLSVYGETKLEGEQVVQELLDRFFIVRTSWAFGQHGGNFVKTMLKMGEKTQEIAVVSDQVGSPTYTPDLASLICDMIQTDQYGVYQVTNEGECSRAEFAQEVFRLTGEKVQVRPISSGEYPARAKRPLNSRMSKDKLVEMGFSRLPTWQDALKRYLSENVQEKTEIDREGAVSVAKKILVTGAGGYIGRHVVTALCDMGAEVIAADIRQVEVDPRAQMVACDLFSGEKDLYQKLGCPDACLHMAWRDGFVHNSDAHMADLSSHYTFLTNMIDSGLKQLAVMGTMHEVGYWEGAIDENTPCNPQSMYGIAKDALRRSMFLLTGQKGVCLQWLRAYYIYGDDMKNHSIFTKLCEAEKEGKKTFPFTSGKNLYDFITVDELAKQLAASVMQTELTGIINCCTGKPVSLADKVEEFIREHGYSIRLKYGAYPDRPYDSPGVWGDATKIQKIMK